MKLIVKTLVPALVLIVASTAWAGTMKEEGHGMGGHGGMALNMHFPDLDTNTDDMLSWDEFKSRFPRTTKEGFAQLDTDGNGSLDHDEWHAFKEMHKGMGSGMGSPHHGMKMPDASAFNAHFPDMDKDGDDKVSADEFNAFFNDKESCGIVFKTIDANGDGSLDHDEWHDFKSAHGMKHKE